MKAYIEALKDSGVSKDDIFLKVAKKYSLDTILDKDIKARVEKELIKDFGDKRPQIVIEPKTHNFGQVLRSQGTVTNIFKIKNKGNSELIINNVYTACPCTSVYIKVNKYESPVFSTTGAPKDWQVKLQPGKVAELKVTLDLNHKSLNVGNVSRKVLVLSNDPLYPSASATISAELKY
jgi:archaellum component FlaG (FlaF/FlaG flagellin family)